MMFITRQAAMNEPMLSVEEERQAVRSWQQEGDRSALERLLRSHARQVYSQAARWTDNPSHREDLVAEGMIGLMRAADNFDLNQEVRFSTYAGWWVLNGVSAALVRIKTVIDIPVRTYLDASVGRLEGDTQELAQMAMQGAVDLGFGSDTDASIACPNLTPEEEATLRSDKAEQRRMLDAALAQLDPLDADVIRRLKLEDPPETVESLSQEYGMSRDRLRQIEGRALLRLRKRLIEGGFRLGALT
ncbi:sigma-70 family RNA polymerase sigma factor [Albibacillus kandeliae]|uniref:sigma-70 family RNA polymerase sigma factor n=1 Tax=Albibacillus kandeliae TaxID=2174228 RepID=UPI000D69BC16|nr:sigma-70 family RNA polymerase sigma factor [Albibacillus kandeliae]